jgi:hypothetical protein
MNRQAIAIICVCDEVAKSYGFSDLVFCQRLVASGLIITTSTLLYPRTFTGQETTLSPIIDPINRHKKKTRQNSVDSPKNRIPIRAVPNAPIPVQIA